MHMYQARVQLTERAKRPPAALRLPLQLNPLGDSGGGGGGGGGGGSGGGEGDLRCCQSQFHSVRLSLTIWAG